MLEVLELCIQFQFDYKKVYLCECMHSRYKAYNNYYYLLIKDMHFTLIAIG